MKQRERGVATTEFALALPMLLMIMLPILEFGRAYYQYNTIAKSVRQAARYLSVRSPGIDTTRRGTSSCTAIRRAAARRSCRA